VIANLYMNGVRLPRYTVWIMLGLSILSFFYVPYFVEVSGFYINRIPNMIVGFGMVAVLTLARTLDQVKIAKPLRELGDASYTLYLAHPFFIGGTALVVAKFALPLYVHIGMSFVICIIGSYIAYVMVEKPIIKYFRKT